jgi:nitroreductase
MLKNLLRKLFRRLNLLEGAQKLQLFLWAIQNKIRFCVILPLFSWSGFTSSIYYAFISRAFYREHRAVIRGMQAYYNVLRGKRKSDFLLIHNIHSIEKGLCMKPRRDVFALEYIRETVIAYSDYLNLPAQLRNDYQLRWFHDVLEEYFRITTDHLIINKARMHFKRLHSISESELKKVPYVRGEINSLPVDYNQLVKLARQRRSVRWFKQQPVPRELIDKAIELAIQSPSACNRQPFVFRVFDDPKLVNRVQQLPSGTKGFGHNFQAICVLIGTLGAYLDERDKHAIYVDGGLAAMSFMYALETLGLSSCPLNWPDIPAREKLMRKELGLKLYERPLVVIAIGYADPTGLIAYSQKKSLDAIRRYNNEN